MLTGVVRQLCVDPKLDNCSNPHGRRQTRRSSGLYYDFESRNDALLNAKRPPQDGRDPEAAEKSLDRETAGEIQRNHSGAFLTKRPCAVGLTMIRNTPRFSQTRPTNFETLRTDDQRRMTALIEGTRGERIGRLELDSVAFCTTRLLGFEGIGLVEHLLF